MGRDVALKIIPHGELTPFDRFRQEALALSRMKSRHVAHVHDFGRDEELGYYLAMDLIAGVPLEASALGRPLLPHEVLRAARGLLSALGEAHIAGIVHRDIKPSNVLVPGGINGLHDVRLLDFGIARSERRSQVREALGELDTHEGVVVGTPAFLAPELVTGGRATPATDVYAAGLVLFDLLGKGPLFPGETWSDQLAGRLRGDPELDGRVDAPLILLFQRMLARDPAARFSRADEAVSFISDLETAPVLAEDLARESRKSVPPPMSTKLRSSIPPPGAPRQSQFPVARSAGRADGTDGAARPRADRASVDRLAAERARESVARASTAPPSLDPLSGSGRERADGRGPGSLRATALYGTRRLARLEANPELALLECLHALDLAMLDALARRERTADAEPGGNRWGSVTSAIASALRLDFHGAAASLASVDSPEARAVGATLIAPRSSKRLAAAFERPREQSSEPTPSQGVGVGVDDDDAWLDAISPELAAVLSTLALGLAPQEAAARHRERCRRALLRLRDIPVEERSWEALPDLSGVLGTGTRRTTIMTTLAMADWCAQALLGAVPRSRARDECLKLRDVEALPLSPLQTFTRALLVAFATANADQHVTREQLERASKLAVESGATLLEVRAMVAWGGQLLEIPGRAEQGMGILDRAAALLDGAHAPSLQYIAEHNRGAAFLVQGRYKEAATCTRRARQAAAGELSLEHELLSTASEIHALLAMGDRAGASALLSTVDEARIASATGRTRMHVRCTRSLALVQAGDIPAAEAALRPQGEVIDVEEASDGYLLAESLAIVCAWARGQRETFMARAGELEKVAQDRGHPSFQFLRMYEAIVSFVEDSELRSQLNDALSRLTLLVVPEAERAD